MRNLIIKLFCIGIFGGLFFVFPSVSYAVDFYFDYQVHYDVAATGSTHVTQNITITNNTTSLLAQNFTLILTSQKITAVHAADNATILKPTVTVTDTQSIISVPFASLAAGINKQYAFTISYDTADIAHKNGEIWEIIIPGIAMKPETRSYDISLTVPREFGAPAYIAPPIPPSGVWTLADHGGHGVNAAYGKLQHFAFTLKYQLKNQTDTPNLQEITLPPDTNFQKVIVANISQTPENVNVDPDGNWLAQYRMDPHTTKNIEVTGSVFISVSPQFGEKKSLTPEEIMTYTKPLKYWEQTPEIKALAAQLKTPKDIYTYVVDHLTYDYARVNVGIERLGAQGVLNTPEQAVCMEFTDLFVALARASGIPARAIHGYAYTTNSRLQPLSVVTDVLHAWPQYFDKNQGIWISVDPTWGNTTHGVDYFSKLDFNHIAFAILGVESDYPVPPGASTSDQEKHVFVSFSKDGAQLPNAQFSADFLSNQRLYSGRENKITLRVKNTGEVGFTPTDLSFETTVPISAATSDREIAPLGYQDVSVSLRPPRNFQTQKLPVTIVLLGKTFQSSLTVLPFYYPLVPWFFVGLFIISLFGILIWHYAKSRAPSHR